MSTSLLPGEPGGCDESDFADLPSGAVALLNYTTNDEHCSLYQRVSSVCVCVCVCVYVPGHRRSSYWCSDYHTTFFFTWCGICCCTAELHPPTVHSINLVKAMLCS